MCLFNCSQWSDCSLAPIFRYYLHSSWKRKKKLFGTSHQFGHFVPEFQIKLQIKQSTIEVRQCFETWRPHDSLGIPPFQSLDQLDRLLSENGQNVVLTPQGIEVSDSNQSKDFDVEDGKLRSGPSLVLSKATCYKPGRGSVWIFLVSYSLQENDVTNLFLHLCISLHGLSLMPLFNFRYLWLFIPAWESVTFVIK